MPCPDGFDCRGTYLFRSVQVAAPELTFYPTLRYRDIPVHVWNGWHPESEEPLLSILVPGRPSRSLDEPRELVRQRWQQLMDDGWTDGGRDGMAGYVHVDHPEFEKIEGPPPEGAF